MTKQELEAFAKEAAKGLKSHQDLLDFSQMLTKITVEAALNAELDEHLGYEKNQKDTSINYRNGSSTKTLKTEDGQFELDTPRDREGSFEPQLVKKNQTRFTSMDDKILSLYARGMTTRDIVDSFKEMYNADISPTLISKVTNAVIDEVNEWQNRPLDSLYPIVYLDCIVVKIRQDNRVINKAVFLALAINLDGEKELLGLWFAENEGAKFWLNVLIELKNRGVEDILIACVDGLKGFPDAINTVYPETHIQLCIVHMIRKLKVWCRLKSKLLSVMQRYGASDTFSKSLSYQKLIFKFTLYSVVQYYCFALFITINNKYFVIIFKLPNYQTTKLPNYQTTKLPN
ncbi:IS256 family transposase, partial [Photobacterium carnosum]|uniref:IS256 family transposase n=1 Tax=Photobacterium carnosum TaxID=2023717 RepID=UPI001E59ECB5